MQVDTLELAGLAARLQYAAVLLETADAHAGSGDSLLRYVNHWVSSGWAVDELVRTARAGTPGLQTLAASARRLAADLEVQRLWYEEAERRNTTLFRPPVWRTLVRLAPPKLLDIRIRLALRGIDVGRVGGHLMAAMTSLEDSPVPDAVLAQRHTAALAEELQYMNADVLDGSVMVDGELVDVRDLTAVQRSALGLVPLLAAVGLVPHGRRLDGVDVALRHDPTELTAPGALGRHGPAAAVGPGASAVLATTIGRPVPAPPRTSSQALGRIHALEDQIRSRGTGAVEVLRTTTPDGDRHWTVIVPGTQDPWAGGPNPMDNETNLLATAGVRSDMEVGVAAAMHQAGIVPGEPVAMVGHSQGGLVSTRLAADPVLAGQFSITTVLTAGSPVATVDVPPGVSVLSLEDVNDPVVGLDGAPNPPAPNHVTVAVASGEPAAVGDPHQLPGYRAAAELLPDVADPAVQDWLVRNREAMGTSVEGARTESIVFEIQRR